MSSEATQFDRTIGCEEVQQLTPDYILGELTDADRAAVEEHLHGGCGSCAAAFSETEATLGAMLEAVPELEPRVELEERLLARAGLTAEGVSVHEQSAQSSLGWWAAIVAASLLCAAGSWFAAAAWHGDENAALSKEVGSWKDKFGKSQIEVDAFGVAVGSKDAVLISFRPTEPASAARGRVLWDPTSRSLCVSVELLPDPEGKDHYSLWIEDAGQKTPVEGFAVVDGQAIMGRRLEGALPAAAAFVITLDREQDNGPGRPVMVARIADAVKLAGHSNPVQVERMANAPRIRR